MKVYIRNSSLKARKMTGFRHKKATKAGRKTLNNQRNIASGKPKRTKVLRLRHVKRKNARRN